MANPSGQTPEPDAASRPEQLESFYRQGHRAYVWGFWVFAAIAAPLLIATVVLAVLAAAGVVPWRLLAIGGLGLMAAGLAAWLRTEDGSDRGRSDFSSVPDI